MADRYGYVRDSSGNRLFPVTHINLILGKDGKPIDKAFYEIDNKLINAQTYEDLMNVDVTEFPYGAIGYVITEETYYSYSSNGWKVMTTGSSNGGGGGGNNEPTDDNYSHIIISAEEPGIDQRNMIWVDTSEDGIIEGQDDLNLLYSLLEKVTEMQNEIVSLRKRVKYLEENGVVGPNIPDKPDDPTDDEDDIILLEDGTALLMEDGSEVLLEKQVVDEPSVDEDDAVLLEDGSEILLEDGSSLLLEIQTEVEKPTTTKNVLLFENGTEVLLENGATILLEMQ